MITWCNRSDVVLNNLPPRCLEEQDWNLNEDWNYFLLPPRKSRELEIPTRSGLKRSLARKFHSPQILKFHSSIGHCFSLYLYRPQCLLSYVLNVISEKLCTIKTCFFFYWDNIMLLLCLIFAYLSMRWRIWIFIIYVRAF